MKRFFPYLISLQQCLCGLWIMIVLVQAFLPQTFSLLGCGLFFFVQWGLSHLSSEKRPALRTSLYFFCILLFAVLIPKHRDVLTIGLTAVGLMLETGLIFSLKELRDCSWGRLGIGGLVLVLLNLLSPSPALIRSSLLLALAALCLRVQSQFINPANPVSLMNLDPDQEKLLLKLAGLQLFVTVLIGPISSVILLLAQLLSQGLTWILSLLIEAFAFVFSAIILSLQSLIRWILAHQKGAESTPSLTPQPEATMTPSPESATSGSSFFNGFLALVLLIVAIFLLVSLLRWLIRLIRKSRPVSLEGGFASEKINSSKISARPTLRQRLHAWLHPETLSPLRKQYKEAVDLRIQQGHPFAPHATPWEYWNEVKAEEADDTFRKLTEAYNEERYRPAANAEMKTGTER